MGNLSKLLGLLDLWQMPNSARQEEPRLIVISLLRQPIPWEELYRLCFIVQVSSFLKTGISFLESIYLFGCSGS